MKRLLFPILLTIGICHQSMAQIAQPGLAAKTKDFADEVYKDCMIYAGPQYLAVYEEWLSRVEIKSQPYSSSEGYPLLSSIQFKNKCNQALVRDNEQNFNPASFNPFKYFFEFETKSEKRYRVDQTDYVIVIHPKH